MNYHQTDRLGTFLVLFLIFIFIVGVLTIAGAFEAGPLAQLAAWLGF